MTFLQTVWAYVHGKPIDVKQVIELTRVDEHGNRTTQVLEISSVPGQSVLLAKELRPYQRQLWESRKRWNCWVCHRRFGKSALTLLLSLHDLTHNTQRQPRYAYIAPLYRQAKAIAWDMLSRYASKFDDTVINQAELRVDFPNGGQIRLYGADNPDSLRGIYLDGVVFDEYAQMRERVWSEVVRPALADRNGWAIFIGTPYGKNHFHTLYQQAQTEPGWHAALYTVEDTGVIPAEELESSRGMMAPEQYAQEWMCSFEIRLDRFLLRLLSRHRQGGTAPHARAAQPQRARAHRLGLRRGRCDGHLVCTACRQNVARD